MTDYLFHSSTPKSDKALPWVTMVFMVVAVAGIFITKGADQLTNIVMTVVTLVLMGLVFATAGGLWDRLPARKPSVKAHYPSRKEMRQTRLEKKIEQLVDRELKR